MVHSDILCAQNPEPRDLLIKAEKALADKNLFVYSIDYKIKRFDDNDTTQTPRYNCTIYRKETDSVLGFYGRVTSPLGAGDERIYDGKDFKLIFNKAKHVILDNPAESGKSFAKNNIRLELIPRFLYTPSPFKRFLSSDTKITAMNSSKINGQDCWEIHLELKPDEEITSRTVVLYLLKKSLFPVKFVQRAKYMNIQDEYIEYTLHGLKASRIVEKTLRLPNSYPKDYKTEKFIHPDFAETLLPVGTVINSLTVEDIDGQLIDIVEESNHKLILLDFWYLACAPCLRAIPELVKLQVRYRDKGLSVVGVNCIDTSNAKKPEIEKFKKRLGVNYRLTTGNDATSKLFGIKQFPTYFAVYKGKVVFSTHSAEFLQKIDGYLNELQIQGTHGK